MDSPGEVLMSTRELGCRRTNFHADKYLKKVIGQLDLEKHLVERDWDRRMKTLTLQKQKRMPNLWDNRSKPSVLRPRSAWEGSMHKNYVMTRPQTVGGPAYAPSPVPKHWHFLASYTATPDGKRIPNTCQSNKTSPTHRKDLKSARPTATNTKPISIKPRRAASAPVRRSGVSTCIITQMPTFDEDLVQLQNQNGEVDSERVDNSSRSSDTPNHNHLTLPSQKRVLGQLRPHSAVASVKPEHSRRSKVNGHVSNKGGSHSDLIKS